MIAERGRGRTLEKVAAAPRHSTGWPHRGERVAHFDFLASSLKYASITARSLAGMPRVSSTSALARSFSGSLPQTSASSLTFFDSASPLPWALLLMVSLAGLVDFS